jgi:hypothetical protein
MRKWEEFVALVPPRERVVGRPALICRRILRVDKTLSDSAMAGDDFQILISYALWDQWGEIAVEREGTARTARADLVAQHRRGQEPAPAMLTELLASMVAISAAAHALDALYGQLVTPEIKAAGPGDDQRREAHIRECLKRRFDTGKRDREWVSRFKRLFDLRDAAVHAKVELLPAVPHPSGVSNAGQVNADYSAEEAVKAVDLMLDVLNTCVQNPKPSEAEGKKWAADHGPAVQTLTTKLRVSRDARPLVIYRD